MVRHVLKVMFVFSLLDHGRLAVERTRRISRNGAAVRGFQPAAICGWSHAALAELIVGELERAGVVHRADGFLFAA